MATPQTEEQIGYLVITPQTCPLQSQPYILNKLSSLHINKLKNTHLFEDGVAVGDLVDEDLVTLSSLFYQHTCGARLLAHRKIHIAKGIERPSELFFQSQ